MFCVLSLNDKFLPNPPPHLRDCALQILAPPAIVAFRYISPPRLKYMNKTELFITPDTREKKKEQKSMK